MEKAPTINSHKEINAAAAMCRAALSVTCAPSGNAARYDLPTRSARSRIAQIENSMPSRDEILNAKILVVDDNADNIELMLEILSEAGYSDVNSTMLPEQVCPLHRQHCYDLILLDLQMPELNGFQVMKGLKEIEQGGYLPVLALTAQPSFKIAALEAGARDFISKPFDLLEVHKRIHNMLEVRLLYKELAQYSKQHASNTRRPSCIWTWMVSKPSTTPTATPMATTS